MCAPPSVTSMSRWQPSRRVSAREPRSRTPAHPDDGSEPCRMRTWTTPIRRSGACESTVSTMLSAIAGSMHGCSCSILDSRTGRRPRQPSAGSDDVDQIPRNRKDPSPPNGRTVDRSRRRPASQLVASASARIRTREVVMTQLSERPVARRLVVRGVVQGVGFRPHVARIAREPRVGWKACRNDATSVLIDVEGRPMMSRCSSGDSSPKTTAGPHPQCGQ